MFVLAVTAATNPSCTDLPKSIFLNLPYVLVPPYDFRREKHFRNGSAVTHVEFGRWRQSTIDAVRLEAPYPGMRPDIEN